MDEAVAVGMGQGGEASLRQRILQGMQTLRGRLDSVLLWTGYLSGSLFALLAFFITYDVLARNWGSLMGLPTTRVTDELSGYVLALAATWGLAYTLRTDAHVRIDVLLPYMSPRLRALVDFLGMSCMGFFAYMITWKTWILMSDSFVNDIRSSTYLLTPLFIPQAIVGIGFGLLAVTAITLAVTDVVEWVLSWGRATPFPGGAAASEASRASPAPTSADMTTPDAI